MGKVLLFGGSFDPIHFGHLIISRFVAEQLGVERVILLPGSNPPHKQDRELAAAADRVAMCRLAVAGDGLFEVSDWEVGQPGLSYTLHTVQHFRAALPADTQLYWLVGMDSLLELGTWHRTAELVQSCTIVTACRPGYEKPDLSSLRDALAPAQIDALARHILESPRIDISATDIRARVRAGRSIRYLVPDAVWQYILERRLYRAG